MGYHRRGLVTKVLDIIKTGAILGESPVWSEQEQVLYWIDIKSPAIHCFNPITRENKSWKMKQEIGSIALRQGGGLIAGFRSGIALINSDMKTIKSIASPEYNNPKSRFNDGKCDRQGRFWAGTMYDPPGPPNKYFDREPIGKLYRVNSKYECKTIVDNILVPNGLAWSPDGSVMYFSDSPKRIIWAYDYNIDSGEPGKRNIFAKIPKGFNRGTCDGATVDCEGYYWSSEFRGGRLVRYSPNGDINRTIKLPVTRPTSCAFGGKDLSILYVTSAKIMMNEEELELDFNAGNLLALDVGVCGIRETHFPT